MDLDTFQTTLAGSTQGDVLAAVYDDTNDMIYYAFESGGSTGMVKHKMSDPFDVIQSLGSVDAEFEIHGLTWSARRRRMYVTAAKFFDPRGQKLYEVLVDEDPVVINVLWERDCTGADQSGPDIDVAEKYLYFYTGCERPRVTLQFDLDDVARMYDT